MFFPVLYNLIEVNRKELHDLAEKKNFNFQDPIVLEKSNYLDKLINIYLKTVTLIYVNLSQDLSA